MLFQIWSSQGHRPTRDLDLLGYGSPSPAELERIFREICECEAEEDGINFQTETIRTSPIKEDQEYQGVRLMLAAKLAAARIPIQIDIGFGDAITPGPETITYPTLLGQPAPELKAYPRETVVAEKYQAMVALGIANSRMKDFFDVQFLAHEYEFSGPALCSALRATFARRKTALPRDIPLALTTEFSEDQQKRIQWQAFVRKGKLEAGTRHLPEIVDRLREFLLPPTAAIVAGTDFTLHWPRNGPWQPQAMP
jgi:hypothetical protein